MARRFLTLWLALNVLAFITANQPWYSLTINTGDPATQVSGTGFDADKSLSAILLFGLAAWLLVAFSRGWAATIISFTAAATSVFLLVTTALGFARFNIGGISSTVEKHTGIAVKPILSDNETSLISGHLEVWALLTLVVLALLAAVQLLFAIKYRKWAKSAKPKSDRTQKVDAERQGDDAISLWDSQR